MSQPMWLPVINEKGPHPDSFEINQCSKKDFPLGFLEEVGEFCVSAKGDWYSYLHRDGVVRKSAAKEELGERTPNKEFFTGYFDSREQAEAAIATYRANYSSG